VRALFLAAVAIRRFADDLQVAIGSQEHAQALPHDSVIVLDQNPNSHSFLPHWSDKPPPSKVGITTVHLCDATARETQ
jgi:hypothetical protein